MMAACQSSRDERIRLARLMPARFNIILTAASDTSTILPIAMLDYRLVIFDVTWPIRARMTVSGTPVRLIRLAARSAIAVVPCTRRYGPCLMRVWERQRDPGLEAGE